MPESTSTGGRKPRVTDADLLDVFQSAGDPVLSTAEVADAVPIKRRGTLNRLRDLEDAGRLDSKQIGGRNTVWWLLDDVGQSLTNSSANSDAVDRGVQGSVDTSLADDPDDDDPDAKEQANRDAAEEADEIAAAIASVDTPGSGEPHERREQALREAYEYLRDNGTASRSEFEDLLGDDVGYSAGFRSWWNNYVQARDALTQLPNVDPPAEAEHTWHYTGEDTDAVEDSGIYDSSEGFQ